MTRRRAVAHFVAGQIRKFLAKNRRLHRERLPPWAPDHNPVEQVWSWLK